MTIDIKSKYLNNNQKNIHQEMIRVDHAGEYGANVIYQGQIAAFKLKNDNQTIAIIEEMKKQEEEHFAYFNQKIQQYKIRPSIMHPIWHFGGFALGFATAMISKKAAMVCTTAVEEVIDSHYQEQLQILDDFSAQFTSDDKNQSSKIESSIVNDDISSNINIDKEDCVDLSSKIINFRNHELEHRDTAYNNQAKDFILFTPLSLAIKFITKTAIAISKKI